MARMREPQKFSPVLTANRNSKLSDLTSFTGTDYCRFRRNYISCNFIGVACS
ncbi:MAG: hypothetical protein M3X11_04660 [Acidobacteriota bacterium]|nr:hypothetical protein [Acidobacteriota bacterium]